MLICSSKKILFNEQSVAENVYLHMQIIVFVLLQLLSCHLQEPAPLQQSKGSVTVTVTQISSQKREILAALFADADAFPNNDKAAFKVARGKATAGKVVLQFEQVPPGTYAVALFHDVNGDAKMNTNLLGIPKEGYGVSNNAKNLFSGPTFRQSSFEHRNNTTLTIIMRY